MVVDILGTEYTVTRNTSAIEDMGADGICQPYDKKIIYRELNSKESKERSGYPA